MTKKSLVRSAAIVASFLVCAPRVASADIITFTNQGLFNIAFSGTLLGVDFDPTDPASNPFQGQTSDNLLYNFSTSVGVLQAQNENTVGRIEGLEDLLIDAADSNVWFDAIRFQIKPDLGDGGPGPYPSVIIRVYDQSEFYESTLPVNNPGDIFFGAIAINGQHIDKVTVSGSRIETVHNVQIGDPIVEPIVQATPEPGTLLLVGAGLAVGAAKARNRRRTR